MHFAKHLVLALIFCTATSVAQESFQLAQGTDVNVRTLGSQFIDPTALSIDNSGHVWVADRVTGKIWRMNASGTPTLVGDVDLPYTVDDVSIRGQLFDIVVIQEPETSNYTVVTLFTNIKGQGIIRSYQSDGFSLESYNDIFTVDDVPINSGYFLSSLGDGTLLACVGAFDNTAPSDLTTLNAKLIRFNVDGTAPSDNPMFDAQNPTAAKSFVYSYGHRQMASVAVVPSDHGSLAGSLYGVEPGAKGSDEINKIEAGRNHGWRHTSGYSSTKNDVYVCPSATFSLVPSSVAFYSSTAIPEWTNSLLIGTMEEYGGLIVADVDPNGMISNIDDTRPSDDVLVVDDTRQFIFTSDTDVERIRDVTISDDGRVYVAMCELGATRRGRVVVLENPIVHTAVSVDESDLGQKGAMYSYGPNPLSDQLHITLDEPVRGNWTLKIVDLVGRPLVQQTVDGSAQSVSVNTSILPSGAYLLVVDNGSGSYASPLTR